MHEPNIQLVPVCHEHKEALAEGVERLSSVMALRIPQGWPQFPEAFDPNNHQKYTEWSGYIFVSTSHQSLVGNGGFVGPPIAGEVEIGYEIAPEFRNQGFATSAVRALLRVAFSSREVQAVVAHTLAERNASNAVLVKLGMAFVAELPNPEVGKVWRWRTQRKVVNGAAAEA